ncbi:MAG: hypothetical protein OXE79_09215 [Acidimicrobiaceae bacterium]|nr:hypothetical protein [Acidimicrobiaceae bacterium]MCY4280751.1 hypothetical protein [Acidimicrobiaceae bacterium]MCY4295197.1 hypothetical protein [Acidimicrobiaceae bacterium]
MTSGCLTALLGRDVVRVTGSDAAGFLQGQISQDVESLADGASAWSLLLTPQGRIDAWFRITRSLADVFLIDVDAGYGAAVVARLERFRLRTDAAFEVLSGWRMLAVRGIGDTADDAAEAAVAEAAAEVRAEVDWPEWRGVDLLGPGLAAPAGTLPSAPQRFEAARIRAGWPRLGREITERTIPAEVGGLVEASVSFTKGCYTGQELIARIDSRGGNVPRPLRLLEIQDDTAPPAATTVEVGGEAVGEITSSAPDPDLGVTVALAAVHRRVVVPAEAEVAGAPAAVMPTPAARRAHATAARPARGDQANARRKPLGGG